MWTSDNLYHTLELQWLFVQSHCRNTDIIFIFGGAFATQWLL